MYFRKVSSILGKARMIPRTRKSQRSSEACNRRNPATGKGTHKLHNIMVSETGSFITELTRRSARA